MELIFEIRDAEEGGFYARALGHGILTQGEAWDELRGTLLEALSLHFEDVTAPSGRGCVCAGNKYPPRIVCGNVVHRFRHGINPAYVSNRQIGVGRVPHRSRPFTAVSEFRYRHPILGGVSGTRAYRLSTGRNRGRNRHIC
jgi:hypothetical protein